MKRLKMLLPWMAVVMALGLLGGCASVCGVEKAAPKAPPAPVVKKWEGAAPKPVTEKPAPAPMLPTTYTVEKCDDLWSISAKPQIYNDPWLWCLLWNANKDKIKNPNKLKVGLVLQVPRNVSDADKAAARKCSKKFPKYKPPAGAKRYCPPK
ncbi:MAG: LysM peptidoglycan-binding domain-containing protein [Desulfarculus sp.]|jgi:Tfp pilus assembly protein FimV|nr:MAG: LysM peptidoglycan-binding domain-containing protein [Desulfarculus sp.]